MEKKQIPHYGLLTGPAKRAGRAVWTYKFSRYDADFIRKCAQALKDQAKRTEKLILVAGNGMEKNLLPEVGSGKVTEHPAFQGALKKLQITLRDPEEITVCFTAGENTVVIEADPLFGEETMTMIIEHAVHAVVTGCDAQADISEWRRQIDARKAIDRLAREMEAQKRSQTPEKPPVETPKKPPEPETVPEEPPEKKITPGRIGRAVLLVVALCVIWFFISRNSYGLAEQWLEVSNYAEARDHYRIAFIWPGALKQAREIERPAEYQLGETCYQEAMLSFSDRDYDTAEKYLTKAIKHFQKADGYPGANERLEDCAQHIHLCNAWNAYSEGDYVNAREEALAAKNTPGFSGVIKVVDAALAYEEGIIFLEKKDYAAALPLLEAAGTHPGAEKGRQECCYQLGVAAVEAGDYEAAKDYLTRADSHREAKALMEEIGLEIGKAFLAERNFKEAQYQFNVEKNAGNATAELDYYITLCEAEIAFSEGRLEDGIDLFGQIPETFRPAEFDVPARREAVRNAEIFAKLDGSYGSSSYEIEYEGETYTYFYPAGSLKDMSLVIECNLEPDGTVTLYAEATFYYFSKEPLSMNYYDDTKMTAYFSSTDLTSVPECIDEGDIVLVLNGDYPKTSYTSGRSTSIVTYNDKR